MTQPQVVEVPDNSFDPAALAKSIAGRLGADQAGISAGEVEKELASEVVETKPEGTMETVTETAKPEGETEIVEEALEAGTPEEIAQVEQLLGEAGFDFGIAYADVPEELKPFYGRVLQNAVDVAQTALQQRIEADELVEQVKEFAQRLKEEPDKLLVSVALANPEAFGKAVTTYTEMQSDERVKDLVVRELRAEARLREAERRDRVNTQSNHQVKIQRVLSAARRAAQVHGVPWNLAETKVADTIRANSGDIEPGAVDGVLKAYAAELSKAGRKPVVRVATKAKVDATKTVPNQPTGGTTVPVTPSKEPSKGLTLATPHQRLKGIIRGAMAGLKVGAQ